MCDDGDGDTTINVFGPFDSEEAARNWAESEATKQWESPSGVTSKAFESERLLNATEILLPLARNPYGFPESDNHWFSVKELTSPNAAQPQKEGES